MSTNVLEIRRQGRLIHLALNRPDKRNALNLELCRELVAAIDLADSDPAIGAILLSGNGKSFCAGMDLSEISTAEPDALSHLHERLFTTGWRAMTPIVAAVHGAALAGGTGLAANAHILIAASDATFGLTEVRIGLWPFLIFRSVSLAMGERRATELALTGRIFPAQEAREFGLVHQIAPDPLAAAKQIAEELAQSSADAIRSGLEYLRESRSKSWAEAGEIGRHIREQVIRSGDFAEGLASFHERRSPNWPSIRQ
jgi:enoyl-CoA hydratase/carnithine racemase